MTKYEVALRARRGEGSRMGLLVRGAFEAVNDEAAVGVATVDASKRYPEENGWTVEASFEIDRPCRFCGLQVTSSRADVDFCRMCYYHGKPLEETPTVAQLMGRLVGVDGIVPESVGIWHTGGGCFALGGRFVDGAYFMVTDGDAYVGEPPWVVGYYAGEEDDEGTPHRADWEADLVSVEQVVAEVNRLRAEAV